MFCKTWFWILIVLFQNVTKINVFYHTRAQDNNPKSLAQFILFSRMHELVIKPHMLKAITSKADIKKGFQQNQVTNNRLNQTEEPIRWKHNQLTSPFPHATEFSTKKVKTNTYHPIRHERNSPAQRKPQNPITKKASQSTHQKHNPWRKLIAN